MIYCPFYVLLHWIYQIFIENFPGRLSLSQQQPSPRLLLRVGLMFVTVFVFGPSAPQLTPQLLPSCLFSEPLSMNFQCCAPSASWVCSSPAVGAHPSLLLLQCLHEGPTWFLVTAHLKIREGPGLSEGPPTQCVIPGCSSATFLYRVCSGNEFLVLGHFWVASDRNST